MRLENGISPDGQRDDKFAVIIPVYNHELTVAAVARQAVALGFPVFVIDDGSTDSSFNQVKDIAGVDLLRHTINRGKGAAIMTGMAAAATMANWVITLDADGQHRPADGINLIKAIPENKRPLVIGVRQAMRRAKAPWTSRFGRTFSNFWVRASGGPRVNDSQSGFRIYPLPESLHLDVKSRRFQFEIEMLVKAHWFGWTVLEAPVSVSYRPGTPRISHFHPWIDFFRNIGLFSRLISHRIFTLRFLSDVKRARKP